MFTLPTQWEGWPLLVLRTHVRSLGGSRINLKDCEVQLAREYNNPVDPNAIRVLVTPLAGSAATNSKEPETDARGRPRLDPRRYLPRQVASFVAPLSDAGLISLQVDAGWSWADAWDSVIYDAIGSARSADAVSRSEDVACWSIDAASIDLLPMTLSQKWHSLIAHNNGTPSAMTTSAPSSGLAILPLPLPSFSGVTEQSQVSVLEDTTTSVTHDVCDQGMPKQAMPLRRAFREIPGPSRVSISISLTRLGLDFVSPAVEAVASEQFLQNNPNVRLVPACILLMYLFLAKVTTQPLCFGTELRRVTFALQDVRGVLNLPVIPSFLDTELRSSVAMRDEESFFLQSLARKAVDALDSELRSAKTLIEQDITTLVLNNEPLPAHRSKYDREESAFDYDSGGSSPLPGGAQFDSSSGMSKYEIGYPVSDSRNSFTFEAAGLNVTPQSNANDEDTKESAATSVPFYQFSRTSTDLNRRQLIVQICLAIHRHSTLFTLREIFLLIAFAMLSEDTQRFLIRMLLRVRRGPRWISLADLRQRIRDVRCVYVAAAEAAAPVLMPTRCFEPEPSQGISPGFEFLDEAHPDVPSFPEHLSRLYSYLSQKHEEGDGEADLPLGFQFEESPFLENLSAVAATALQTPSGRRDLMTKLISFLPINVLKEFVSRAGLKIPNFQTMVGKFQSPQHRGIGDARKALLQYLSNQRSFFTPIRRSSDSLTESSPFQSPPLSRPAQSPKQEYEQDLVQTNASGTHIKQESQISSRSLALTPRQSAAKPKRETPPSSRGMTKLHQMQQRNTTPIRANSTQTTLFSMWTKQQNVIVAQHSPQKASATAVTRITTSAWEWESEIKTAVLEQKSPINPMTTPVRARRGSRLLDGTRQDLSQSTRETSTPSVIEIDLDSPDETQESAKCEHTAGLCSEPVEVTRELTVHAVDETHIASESQITHEVRVETESSITSTQLFPSDQPPDSMRFLKQEGDAAVRDISSPVNSILLESRPILHDSPSSASSSLLESPRLLKLLLLLAGPHVKLRPDFIRVVSLVTSLYYHAPSIEMQASTPFPLFERMGRLKFKRPLSDVTIRPLVIWDEFVHFVSTTPFPILESFLSCVDQELANLGIAKRSDETLILNEELRPLAEKFMEQTSHFIQQARGSHLFTIYPDASQVEIQPRSELIAVLAEHSGLLLERGGRSVPPDVMAKRLAIWTGRTLPWLSRIIRSYTIFPRLVSLEASIRDKNKVPSSQTADVDTTKVEWLPVFRKRPEFIRFIHAQQVLDGVEQFAAIVVDNSQSWTSAARGGAGGGGGWATIEFSGGSGLPASEASARSDVTDASVGQVLGLGGNDPFTIRPDPLNVLAQVNQIAARTHWRQIWEDPKLGVGRGKMTNAVTVADLQVETSFTAFPRFHEHEEPINLDSSSFLNALQLADHAFALLGLSLVNVGLKLSSSPLKLPVPLSLLVESNLAFPIHCLCHSSSNVMIGAHPYIAPESLEDIIKEHTDSRLSILAVRSLQRASMRLRALVEGTPAAQYLDRGRLSVSSNDAKANEWIGIIPATLSFTTIPLARVHEVRAAQGGFGISKAEASDASKPTAQGLRSPPKSPKSRARKGTPSPSSFSESQALTSMSIHQELNTSMESPNDHNTYPSGNDNSFEPKMVSVSPNILKRPLSDDRLVPDTRLILPTLCKLFTVIFNYSVLGRATNLPHGSSSSVPHAIASHPPSSNSNDSESCYPLPSSLRALLTEIMPGDLEFSSPMAEDRFVSPYALMLACHYGLKLTERAKQPLLVVLLGCHLCIYSIISGAAPQRRSGWYLRIMVSLSSHLRRPLLALAFGLVALMDPAVRTGDKVELTDRVLALWRKLCARAYNHQARQHQVANRKRGRGASRAVQTTTVTAPTATSQDNRYQSENAVRVVDVTDEVTEACVTSPSTPTKSRSPRSRRTKQMTSGSADTVDVSNESLSTNETKGETGSNTTMAPLDLNPLCLPHEILREGWDGNATVLTQSGLDAAFDSDISTRHIQKFQTTYENAGVYGVHENDCPEVCFSLYRFALLLSYSVGTSPLQSSLETSLLDKFDAPDFLAVADDLFVSMLPNLSPHAFRNKQLFPYPGNLLTYPYRVPSIVHPVLTEPAPLPVPFIHLLHRAIRQTWINITYIEGRPNNRVTGQKSRFIGYDDMPCGVEELVLQYFGQPEMGGWQGAHVENSLIFTLFGILMWDAIWAPPEVITTERGLQRSGCTLLDLLNLNSTLRYYPPSPFQNDHADAPIDLDSDGFYLSRRNTIDRCLARIAKCNPVFPGDEEIPGESGIPGPRRERLADIVFETYAKHAGVRCRGVNWSRWPPQILAHIAECIGPEALVLICSALVRGFRYWSGGLPDLCLWVPPPVFVELPSTFTQPETAINSVEGTDFLGALDDSMITALSEEAKKYHSLSLVGEDTDPTNDLYDTSFENDLESEFNGEPVVQATSIGKKRSTALSTPLSTPKRVQRASPTSPTPSSEFSQNQGDGSAFGESLEEEYLLMDRADGADTEETPTPSHSAVSAWVDGFLRAYVPELAVTREQLLARRSRRPHHRPERIRFVEVKGPRDRLSAQQIAWLELLAPFVSMEVCFVREPESMPDAVRARRMEITNARTLYREKQQGAAGQTIGRHKSEP